MPSLGDKTNQIVKLHESGVSVEDIASQFGISLRSVEKRLSSYKKVRLGLYPAPQIEPKWNNENIKAGFDRFITENGRLPTAYEIDDCSYLPSARQIQRRFGGLSNLFGIDVFSTDDKRYVVKNIGVKLPKYLSFPSTIPLFFVIAGDNLTQEEVDLISTSIVRLAELPMAKLITVSALYDYLKTIEPLALPDGLTSYVNP
jgi:hypothetical protein